MKNLAILIATTVFMGLTAQAAPQPTRWNPSSRQAASAAPSKRDVLAKLKVLQDQQIAESTDLENAIRKQLNETMKLEIGNDDLEIAGRRTNLVTKKIDELNKRRTELNAKREIVDRLIFQVDSKWDGHSPLKEFLTAIFIDMASTDLSEGRDNRLWKEFTYLSMVMREVPERDDDVIALFQGYLNSGSVLEPKTPADFIADRNYTNGAESMKANMGDRSLVGQGLTPQAQQPVQVVVATAPTPIAKSSTETAEKAQLDSGQVPMSATAPAGKADGKDAAPKSTGEATRAATTTSATSQSAADLAAHADKTPGVTPRPVEPSHK